MHKYSKPTMYHNVQFRSRLEADFARWFDSLNIVWSYEQEGYKLSNGLSYLPDFYLPEQKAYFECKGVMLPEDEAKIIALGKESNLDVIMGSHIYDNKPLLSVYDSYNGYFCDKTSDVVVARCLHCKKVWMMAEWGDWTCRICGAYDGNGHFEVLN